MAEKTEQGSTARWRSFAQRHGLVFAMSDQNALITGHVGKVKIDGNIHCIEHRSMDEQRNLSTHWTEKGEIVATSAVDITGLTVTTEGLAAKVGKLFGEQDLQLNDPSFDPLYLIRGTQPVADRVLGPATRAAFVQAHIEKQSVRISDGATRVIITSVISDDRLDALFHALVRVAQALGT